MRRYFPYITRPILVLSLVSLFTDMASEMLYPIMPVYLKTIGFSVLLIGLLEGFAEMIAGLSKGYFGQLSDVQQKRLPFVRLGYFLSAISKPMMAMFTYPVWVFFSRTIDRFGKGLRTAPRDALLSSQTNKENKARVFGFHRSLDTFGAVLGPSIALLFLYFYPGDYRNLFLIAFIPGIIAVLFTFYVKEKKIQPQNKKIHFFTFLHYAFGKNKSGVSGEILPLSAADKNYRRLLIGLLVFALVNSSDVLLLLKMKEAGISDTVVITIYIFYNLAYALFSIPAGMLADKFGIRKIFITGLILFGIVYTGFAINSEPFIYWILFLIYGLYAACTEGIAKAWISNLVVPGETGTAIGTYAALSSVCALVASTLAGFLWYTCGAGYAFGLTATVVAVLIIYFSRLGTKGMM